MSWCAHIFKTVSAFRLSANACAATLLAVLSGCNTFSSLGLPLTGPHQLLRTTKDMREAAGLPAELPRELAKDVLPEYLVEPGDVVIVEPADFNSPTRFSNGEQIVKPDGSIHLGKYGRLTAAGKTVEQIQREVQALVENQTTDDPGPILVRLLGWESKVFYVLGEVNSPGAYPFTGRETVLDALVAAGDLTDRADRHKIVLSRPSFPDECRTVLPICYQQIVQLGDTASNYQILPGDRIFVASMTIWADLAQTLLPGQFEHCPRCATHQIPCLISTCGKNGHHLSTLRGKSRRNPGIAKLSNDEPMSSKKAAR